MIRLLIVFALAVLFLPFVALAEPAAALPVPSPSSGLLGIFIQYVLPTLLTGLFGVITWALGMVGRRNAAEGSATKKDAILGQLSTFAATIVADLEATLVPELKLATADGVLTKAEIERLRTVALNRLKALAGEHGLAEARAILGIASPQLDAFLAGLIERALVAMQKPSAPPVVTLDEAHNVFARVAMAGPQP